MKVIAKVDASRVLCEVTTDELWAIVGIKQYSDEARKFGDPTLVGREIAVDKISRDAAMLRGLAETHVERLEREVTRMQAAVKEVRDATQALTLFDKLIQPGD